MPYLRLILEQQMILPIVSYGNEILRTECNTAIRNEETQALIHDMWETLYATNGVGLAAPQVDNTNNVFIVDSKSLYNDLTDDGRKIFWGDEGIRETFVNATITSYAEETWIHKEGCLSLPKLHIDVERPIAITIKYQDKDFNWHEKNFGGMTARIIQHEYDHTNGILHIDHVNKHNRPLFFNTRLSRIAKRKVRTKYRLAADQN